MKVKEKYMNTKRIKRTRKKIKIQGRKKAIKKSKKRK